MCTLPAILVMYRLNDVVMSPGLPTCNTTPFIARSLARCLDNNQQFACSLTSLVQIPASQ